MKSIKTIFQLIRWNNLLMILIMLYLLAYKLKLAAVPFSIFYDFNFAMMVLSILIIASSGYIINDYYDIKIDSINKPQNVIIGKHIPRRTAMILHSLLNIIGISIGFIISPYLGLINFGSAFLLWLYSNQLKRLPLVGNVTIAFLTFLSVVTLNVFFKTHHLIIYSFAIFAFLMSIIREIIKDIEDIQGDTKFGCKTYPITAGIRASKNIIFFTISLLCVSYLFFLFFSESIYFLFFLPILFVFLFIFSKKVYYADRKSDFTKLSLWAKLIMLSGIALIIFL